jgi:hypothetical protein
LTAASWQVKRFTPALADAPPAASAVEEWPSRPPPERLASSTLNALGIYMTFTPGGFDDRRSWPSLLRCWSPRPTTVASPPPVPLSRYEFVEIGDVMRNG